MADLRTAYIVVGYSRIQDCEVYLHNPFDNKGSYWTDRWENNIDKAYCFEDFEEALNLCEQFGGSGVRRYKF